MIPLRLATDPDLLLRRLPARELVPDRLTKPSCRSSMLRRRLSAIEPRLASLGEPSASLKDSFLLARWRNSSCISVLIVSLPKMTLLELVSLESLPPCLLSCS